MRSRLHLALALALALPAFADNTADEADIAFSLGNAHFVKREFEPALAQYFLSFRLVPNKNVLFNIARCYEALDRLDEAYRYYHDLSVDPSLAADDARDVKVALARLAPKVALVTVTTTPPGAELFVDRQDLGSRGQTPQTIAVAPGAHTLFTVLTGHRTASARLTAQKGKEAKESFSLERIVGTVKLVGTPEGAAVRDTADGPELGRLPATLAFPPGQRLLVVSAKGYLPSQVLVDVKPDVAVTAKVSLVEKPKPTGKVVVTASRDNAVVRVDGKDSGFTPVVLTLVEGRHAIEVTTEEVEPHLESVDVAEGSETRLFAVLHYAPPKVNAASKSALTVDQAPASVTVITREELRAFGYQTLAEALQAVRGIFLTDDRIYTYIGIRGFSPAGDFNTRVLILYDGHPMNDVWAGQGFAGHDFDVDLSEVDHLEVVRGPTSILFGTGAFFGVINVVPRNRVSEKDHVEAVAGVGGQRGAKARVTGSVGEAERSLLLSAGAFQAKGAELTDLGSAGLVVGRDGERTLGASLRARYGDFTLSGTVNQRRKEVPVGALGSVVGAPGTEYLDARGYGELRWAKTVSDTLSVGARLSYDASRYHGALAEDVNGVISRVSEYGGGDWFGLELRGGYRLFEGNTLSLSLEGQGQKTYQQPIGLSAPEPHTRLLFSGTVLDEWQLHERAFVQAGLRVDKYSDLDSLAFSPRAAVVVRPYRNGLSKLVAGQAFRAPTTYELYYNDANLTQRAPLTAPKPETITTFELEHSHDLSPELRLTGGAYYNLISGLVELDTATTGPLCGTPEAQAYCLVFSNSLKPVTALGAEAQLRWQPGRFTLVDATYSFVVLAGVPQAELPAYPAHLASLRAMVPLKEGFARLSGQLTWQSARKDPLGPSVGESLLINLGLSGEMHGFRYFAGVRNLLDERYLLPVATEAGVPVVPQYGRSFWLEAAARF